MKNFTLCLSLLCCSLLSHSQTSLSFCTFVNSQGQPAECVFDNTKFITMPDSSHGRLFMMLRGNALFGTAQLTFKIYNVDKGGKETFNRDIIQNVQPDWMNAWQPEVFTSPGKYVVKVYRDPEHMIATKGFEFFKN